MIFLDILLRVVHNDLDIKIFIILCLLASSNIRPFISKYVYYASICVLSKFKLIKIFKKKLHKYLNESKKLDAKNFKKVML